MRLNSPCRDDEAPRDYEAQDYPEPEAEEAIRCAEEEAAHVCPCDDCPAEANITALCAEHPERCALWLTWHAKRGCHLCPECEHHTLEKRTAESEDPNTNESWYYCLVCGHISESWLENTPRYEGAGYEPHARGDY